MLDEDSFAVLVELDGAHGVRLGGFFHDFFYI